MTRLKFIELISVRLATNGLLSILSMVIVFHVLVLTGVIPFQMVWGGRLSERQEMFVFEAISILLNALMLLAVGLHTGLFRLSVNRKITTVALWLMVILFLVNTVGNLFSNNRTEMIITPLTLILGLLSLRLAVAGSKAEVSEENKR
jgi:hypothetical protein